MKVWECKIGFGSDLPEGADAPLRRAVAEAFKKLVGVEPNFIFSGWGGELTDSEAAEVRTHA